MNIKIEKKIYSAPKMSVMEMCGKLNLLDGSGTKILEDAPNLLNDGEYGDELGFTNPADINRKV